MGRFNNRSILYLHGYNSSSQGKKPQKLRQICSNNRLLIPDLPLNPQECMKLIEQTLQTASNNTIIIGASLGGFFAYYLASKFKRDALLLNPVINPSQEVKKLLEHEKNPEQKEILLNALNIYLDFESNLASFTQPNNCFLALGKNDDIIDPEKSAKHIPESFIKSYNDDHYLLNSFEQIIKEFETYLQDKF